MGPGEMGGGPSFGGLIWLLIIAALTIVPFWKILPRAGLSPWLALVTIIPLGTLVLLWVLAFKRWPGDAGEGAV